jgi:glutaredoxin
MGLAPEDHKKRLVEELGRDLKDEVRILMFTQGNECPFCKQARELAEEVGTLSTKIKVEVYMHACVPKTVVNEKTESVGAVPEELFVQQVVLAPRSPTMYV